MDLDDIKQSEISQTKINPVWYDLDVVSLKKKVKFIRTESKKVIARG